MAQRLVVVLLMFFGNVQLVSAGNSGATTIDTLRIYHRTTPPKVFIKLTNDGNTSKPSCSISSSWHYAMDISTEAGRAAYATLLSAQAQKKQIIMYGVGDCVTYGSAEELSYTNILD